MIRTRGLRKTYANTVAVEGLDLEVERGDIFGFIGPNGAGKTSTIKMLATLLPPSGGEATIDGLSVGRDAERVRRIIGYMPDFFGVYEEMRVDEYLEFFAAAYGIARRERPRIVGDILDLVDLTHKKADIIGSLSRGTQQRLGLARVLVHDPKVLLLDEPASGLDPRARVEIRELIRELGKMGKTILISSHILPELGDVCNKVAIIEHGKLVFTGSVAQVTRQATVGRVILVRTRDRLERALELITAHPAVQSAQIADGTVRATLKDPEACISFAPALLVQAGLQVTFLREEELDLEDAFMRLTRGVVS